MATSTATRPHPGIGRRSTAEPAASTASGRKARQRSELTGFAFVLPFLIAYALFLIWPIILGFRMSFYNWSLTGAGTDQFMGLANYQELLADSSFWASLRNTLFFTVLSTPPLVLLALGLALLANRAIPARWLFRLAFVAPYLLPVSVVTIIWTWLYQPGFGLINQYLTGLGLSEINWLGEAGVAMVAIVITTVWWTVGFNFILYLAGLQEIPHDVYEASSLDGAGAWEQLRSMTIPLLMPTTLLVLALQILASLKVFDQIWLMTAGGPNLSTRPIVQYVYEQAFTSYRVGFASAMAYAFFLLVLVVSLGQLALLRRGQKEGQGHG